MLNFTDTCYIEIRTENRDKTTDVNIKFNCVSLPLLK